MTFKAGDKIRMKEGCGKVGEGKIYKLQGSSGDLFVIDDEYGDYCYCEYKWEIVDNEEESMQGKDGMTCKLAQAAMKTIEYLQKRIEEHIATCGKCATRQK